jgi:hypothetical protein
VASALLAVILAGAPAHAQRVVNIESAGNLESTRPVGCVNLDTITNQHTPADLYPGIAACIRSGDPARSVRLFALAAAYGRFDMQRVADKTAHQAMQVLQMSHIGKVPEADRETLNEAMRALQDPGSEDFHALCAQVRRIGAPAYHPRYMIQHGIRAFDEHAPADGLVKDFQADAVWKKVVDEYLRCPQLP